MVYEKHQPLIDPCGAKIAVAARGSGVAEDCGGLRPHIPYETLPHTDQGGGDQYERKVYKRCQGDIHRLPREPCFAVYTHKVKGRGARYERHVRKEQKQ